MKREASHWDYAHTYLLSYARAQWRGFKLGRHLRYLAGALQRVEKGEITRLIITCPPRHCKSLLTTENFAAWFLGRNPEAQVITGTYGQRLADKWGRKVRNHVRSPIFHRIFPGVKLADDSQAAAAFALNRGGYYFGTGRGGAGTGLGADLFLIDDPTKDRKEADSALIQQTIRDWYTDVVTTRLMPGGRVVIIMTRWTDADLVGFVLKEHQHEGWTIVNLPALAENDDPLGRAPGEALWPEQYNLQELQKKKATLPARSWAALYQQRPVPQEGLIVKPDYFRTQRFRTPPLRPVRTIISLDTARKGEASSDPSVWTVWMETEKGFFLVAVMRRTLEYPSLKATTKSLAEKWHPDLILIEDSANGTALYQDLRATSRLPLLLVGTGGQDKAARLSSCSDLMEGGRVWLPHEAEWLPEYEEELFRFPAVRHDDQVDSTSQALNWFKSKAYQELTYEAVPKGAGGDDYEDDD